MGLDRSNTVKPQNDMVISWDAVILGLGKSTKWFASKMSLWGVQVVECKSLVFIPNGKFELEYHCDQNIHKTLRFFSFN